MMMQALGAALVFVGALISLVAAVGVLRLPDFFMRMHAATKAGVGGAGLVMLGVGFNEGTALVWAKVLLVVFFLLLTTPIAGHLLGRAGYIAGVALWRGTLRDDLRGHLTRGEFEGASTASVQGMFGSKEKEARDAQSDIEH